MKSTKLLLILLLSSIISIPSIAQETAASWEDLRKEYKFPAWYTEARFGIWVHWGAQTEPLQGGGWYARHMYQQDVGNQLWGKNAYAYHNKTYGHPSEIGYKDVLNEWKAERLDTDALVSYFKKLGAKYFVALANHHDHFDNFNSTYHPWNSVNMGPKRDIIKEFEVSCEKFNMPYGVSSHDDRFLSWWLPAFGSDTSGRYKGVPYDGHMTKEDGKGKWWEGLNPADLYGLPPEKRTPEYIEEVKQNWVQRHKELVTKYDIDFLWFDGYGFPYDEYGKEVCEAFFNHKLEEKGEIDAVIAGKVSGESMLVKDIERGGADEILPYPWQGITTLRTWFYKEDPERMEYNQNARTIIELLADYMSKNGNLLLNVELLADGTIPEEQRIILDDIGAWVNLNSEAIYATKPWVIYGDNLNSYLKSEDSGVTETDIKALEEQHKSGHFNERTLESPAYGHDEVRFVTKGDVLYVIVLNPAAGDIELPSLGLSSGYQVGKVTDIEMIGSGEQVKFNQMDEKLVLSVPSERPNIFATVFKLNGVL
ncbi:alpha-L-fucosidase [Echinicola salinicaeni]|uniref:alpha-L-fucosidase n=1 Tax=Echinicola salinicaeni TaxID=2762757 RepID=UPI0016452719|nr:alpha-L-fucosidase [Echinicola salinicaeni]